MSTDELIESIKEYDPTIKLFREIPGHGLCGIKPFIYTVGIVCHLSLDGCFKYRYCYPTKNAKDAVLGLVIWDGKDHPPGNWIKLKGDEHDYTNPNFKK